MALQNAPNRLPRNSFASVTGLTRNLVRASASAANRRCPLSVATL